MTAPRYPTATLSHAASEMPPHKVMRRVRDLLRDAQASAEEIAEFTSEYTRAVQGEERAVIERWVTVAEAPRWDGSYC